MGRCSSSKNFYRQSSNAITFFDRVTFLLAKEKPNDEGAAALYLSVDKSLD